ncbi:DUF4192 domain-containing protein [Jannaschia sp. R86511]|uniref:DUF4192 domain-containing protein n=1 Tax=Jannaschia sp. R86511 TaxID=3093853 RepID=UPI0036D20FD8
MTSRAVPAPPPDDPAPEVRLRDPAGVVAAVPYLLGFAPRRSLVVVGLDRQRSVGPTMRVDWSPDRPVGTTRPVWQQLARVAVRNDCTAALVVVYVDTPLLDLPAAWDDDLREAVLGPCDLPGPAGSLEPDGTAGPDVLDLLVVGPDRFRSLLCGDPSCCPGEGTAVAGTSSHPVAAGFVLAGRSPAPDREALVVEAVVTSRDRLRARDAARAARTTSGRGSRPEVGSADLDLFERWAGSLPDGPDPELAGTLAAAWVTAPRLRDACLALLLPGGRDCALAVLAPHAQAGSALGRVLADPACSRATRVGTPVLRRLAALTEGPERATVLAAHAWLCWVAGEGTAAVVLAERSLDLDPAQSLARLVLQCLGHGLGAAWTTAGPRPGPGGRGGSGARGRPGERRVDARRGYQDGPRPAPRDMSGGWWG